MEGPGQQKGEGSASRVKVCLELKVPNLAAAYLDSPCPLCRLRGAMGTRGRLI
jgi:hypothetical protein